MTNERAKDIIECHLNDLKEKMPENTTLIKALEVAMSQLEYSLLIVYQKIKK